MHLTGKDLEGYLQEELTSEKRNQIESHMETCDSCFDWYMSLLENWTIDVHVSNGFTDLTMKKLTQKLEDQSRYQKESKKTSSYPKQTNRTLVHYLLAAGLTILLMVTGVFQSALEITDKENVINQGTITNQLMKKTDHLLDKMKEGDELHE
jgi:predicted anti-sigma-YlaC factor YlaD